MKEIEATVGYRVENGLGQPINYYGGKTDNGLCYKDDDAFKSGNGICYISEFGLEELHEDLDLLKEDYKDIIMSHKTMREYEEEIINIVNGYGYTRQNLIDLCGGSERIAELLYNTIDWQYPETYTNVLYDDLCGEEKEFYMSCGITEEDIEMFYEFYGEL